MEIEMRASRFPAVAGLAGVVIATSMLVAPASFAQGRHDPALFGDAYARSYAGHVAHGYQAYPGSIPQDYSSSYLCINGYRWITQELDHRESPAENVTPVRCH
jgi:hypothetical protein